MAAAEAAEMLVPTATAADSHNSGLLHVRNNGEIEEKLNFRQVCHIHQPAREMTYSDWIYWKRGRRRIERSRSRYRSDFL